MNDDRIPAHWSRSIVPELPAVADELRPTYHVWREADDQWQETPALQDEPPDAIVTRHWGSPAPLDPNQPTPNDVIANAARLALPELVQVLGLFPYPSIPTDNLRTLRDLLQAER